MKGLTREERQWWGERLKNTPQSDVMAQIPQFNQAEVHNISSIPQKELDRTGVLVFNMERGVHLSELTDFLQNCPQIQPYDVILANELDDGCVRSHQKDTPSEIAARLGMNYVFGLEFIELANEEDSKAYHGNVIFSRWPIQKAHIVRLPEQYNWYFDRQKRIGGRLAILAELNILGHSVGIGTIHLENRTDGAGRQKQMETVLAAAEEMFPDMPIVLGGDLNTNTFDGSDKKAIQTIAGDPVLQRRCLEEVEEWEGALRSAQSAGYRPVPEKPIPTRRKPLPEGGHLDLKLDWLLVRDMDILESRTISTRREDFAFAKPGSPLETFTGEELSDHNAVWGSLKIKNHNYCNVS